MKKLIVVLGVVAIGFCFASCKKDCKCTTKFAIPDEYMQHVPENMKGMLAGTHDAGKLSKKDCEDYKVPLPDLSALSALGEGVTKEAEKYFTYECKSE